VTLSVGNGTLSVGSHNGLTGTFSGSALTFSGLASAVNTALGSVSYTPTSEFEGTDTVHFKASATEEVGGSTSALSTDHTATITVTGIADTPTTGTPASVTTSEGQAVTLTGLSVTEASGDSGDTINVTLSVGNGTLALGTTTGLSGTFSGSALTFSGLASAVNTALGSVSYTPTSEFEGTDTVHFKASSTEEVGGSTSALSTDHTATITVTGVADTPTISTPNTATTTEGHGPITLSGLSVTEASGDSGDTINVTLSVGNGTLDLGKPY